MSNGLAAKEARSSAVLLSIADCYDPAASSSTHPLVNPLGPEEAQHIPNDKLEHVRNTIKKKEMDVRTWDIQKVSKD